MFWQKREELTGKIRYRTAAWSHGMLLQVECLKLHTYPDEDNGGAPIDRVASCYWRDAQAEDLNTLGYLTSDKEALK